MESNKINFPAVILFLFLAAPLSWGAGPAVIDLEGGKSSVMEADTIFRRASVRDEILADWNKSSGLESVYDLSPRPVTAAPKGYEAVYVSHYGRHGSRFAYTDRAYTTLLDVLRDGALQQNLTEYGWQMLRELGPFWLKVRYQVGDLTPLGWHQHQEIAKAMIKSYPKAFGKGSLVDACSSASVRAIISMTSSCTAFSRFAPKAEVYAHQGKLDMQACRPNVGDNPFKYTGPESVFPYKESSEEFFLRRFPNYKDVLARFFKDPGSALGERNAFDVFFHLYMLVSGINNLPEELKIDVSGIFTPEEYATMWEIDNYVRLMEYIEYRTPCSSIVDDMVAKADERLASGSRGADLRFGHDHVVMTLLMIMDIDGFGYFPANPDNLDEWFQTFRSCKASNIQLVFYRPKGKRQGDTLVKVLFNGEDARLGTLASVSGPYYKWSDVKEWFGSRTANFVTK